MRTAHKRAAPKHAKRRPTLPESQTRYRSADERRADGKKLRDRIPRERHAQWRASPHRADPVEIVIRSSEGRLTTLVPIRYGRMAQTPFTFFRGAAAVMAADLAQTPVTGIRVQACGDAHLLNFGGFATPERNIVFDINDFDETLPAPWEWDLKRLATSVMIAGRHLGFTEAESVRVVRATARAYREHMAEYASMRALDVWYSRIDLEALAHHTTRDLMARAEQRIKKARARSVLEHDFPKLVDRRGPVPLIKEDPPLIFHPSTEVAPGMSAQFADAVKRYRQTLPDHVRSLFDRFHFFDLAMKVVGVGSVGTRCSIGLLMAADDDPIFLQVKEAVASVLEPYAGASEHRNHGERVVVGQRRMQSASDVFLGWTRGADGRDYYVRQLHDAKISAIIEDWDPKFLRAYSETCAWALARAHARSGDAAMIAGYLGASSVFDEAICELASDYADQNKADHRAFIEALRSDRIQALDDV